MEWKKRETHASLVDARLAVPTVDVAKLIAGPLVGRPGHGLGHEVVPVWELGFVLMGLLVLMRMLVQLRELPATRLDGNGRGDGVRRRLHLSVGLDGDIGRGRSG